MSGVLNLVDFMELPQDARPQEYPTHRPLGNLSELKPF